MRKSFSIWDSHLPYKTVNDHYKPIYCDAVERIYPCANYFEHHRIFMDKIDLLYH